MSAIQAACTHYLRRCLVPDEAVVGMRLYRDVRLPDGRVLLPAGSVLDAEMLVPSKGVALNTFMRRYRMNAPRRDAGRRRQGLPACRSDFSR